MYITFLYISFLDQDYFTISLKFKKFIMTIQEHKYLQIDIL